MLKFGHIEIDRDGELQAQFAHSPVAELKRDRSTATPAQEVAHSYRSGLQQRAQFQILLCIPSSHEDFRFVIMSTNLLHRVSYKRNKHEAVQRYLHLEERPGAIVNQPVGGMQ